jgi:hypothetical protein
MYPLKMSAQFAAYAWYAEVRGQTTHDEALRFAERDWTNFLPAAHEGWGKLLMRVAGPRRHAARRAKTPAPAMAGMA